MPCSSTMKSTSCFSYQADRSSRCWWLRPMRRSRVTTTWSPGPSLARSPSSLGREASLPEIFSMTTFPGSIPALVSASNWESGFCSRVETRAYPYRVTGLPQVGGPARMPWSVGFLGVGHAGMGLPLAVLDQGLGGVGGGVGVAAGPRRPGAGLRGGGIVLATPLDGETEAGLVLRHFVAAPSPAPGRALS